MAEKMVKCHACNKEIASSAKTCPSCGAKQKKPIFKKWWFWVLIVIFVGIIIPKEEKNADDATPNNDQQQEEKVEEGSMEKPYPKEQKVTVGEVDWQIVSAENIGSVIRSGNPYIDDCKADSGSFIKLVVKVKNNREEVFFPTNLTLVDSQERKFVSSSDVYMCADDDTIFVLDDVNPGIEKTFTAFYEIPDDATGLMLEIDSTGSLLGDETNKYISLGL